MAAPLIQGSRLRLFLQQNGRCFYCKRQMIMALKPPKAWHPMMITRDHVVARSKGGKGLPNNIVGACHRCNCAKGNMPVSRFVPPSASAHLPTPTPAYVYTPCE